ncbi:MAG: hypothetical protein LAO19_12420 [Acidobacteriia bacterium]|nr:hypothetical protein [Terriglobia bacterium]
MKSAYSEMERASGYSSRETQETEGQGGFRQFLIAWAPAEITIVFLVLLAALTYQDPTHKRLPDDLVGEWRTTDTLYADRALILDQVCITFTTGESTLSVGFIKDVKQVAEGSRILYTVAYTVDDVPNQVSFYYEASKGISFKNQDRILWKKFQAG